MSLLKGLKVAVEDEDEDWVLNDQRQPFRPGRGKRGGFLFLYTSTFLVRFEDTLCEDEKFFEFQTTDGAQGHGQGNKRRLARGRCDDYRLTTML